ncbi:TRAP transporter small permease [Anaerotalea alkaliphila]|uniref:TRAP transporter small permease n=1 Tax=Anaerotalea alkaliphila TaxID=2662126 RepID=A0A7X5HXL2_9FIRM|nr:TRAP transporter small permease [Anaerotalea alkaliphila]NDL68366.1 TRAP transporter small permease [Anaerotalea alkaliphila]
MKTIRGTLDRIVEWFCIVTMGVMTLLVTWQVITRYFFNNPSAITERLTQYLFVWLVLYGAAYVFGKRDHMAIVFVEEKLPPSIRRVVEILQEVLIGVFAVGVMVYGGYQSTLKQMVQADASLGIPMGVVYSAIALSGICIVFYSVHNIMELSGKKRAAAMKEEGV